jgi:hypothetical protein
LQFFEFINGETKRISASKFDLDELLFFTGKSSKKDDFYKKLKDLEEKDMPAFLYNDPIPLYFPAVNIQLDDHNNLYIPNFGVLLITKTQRVLLFRNRDKGAEEILMFIEDGEYKIGYIEKKGFYILVYNRKSSLTALYEIELAPLRVKKHDFSDKISDIENVIFTDNTYYVLGKKSSIAIKLLAEIKIYEYHHEGNLTDIFSQNDVKYNRKFFNRGHSLLQRLKKIYINKTGCLSFENYYISVNSQNEIVLASSTILKLSSIYEKFQFIIEDFEVKAMPSNQQIKFYKAEWPDGSVAMLDSRGFLHLKSSNPKNPELTIVLTAGKSCTCWSADGYFTGNPYFIPEGNLKMLGSIFYQKYIQAFIDGILVKK